MTAELTGAAGSWAAVAACCANLYGDPAIELIAGESLHPGGLTVTRALLQKARLPLRARLLDAGCGLGASSRLAALEYGLRVDACDVSGAALARARALAEASGAAVTFHETSVTGPRSMLAGATRDAHSSGMRVAVAADHAGFELKRWVMEWIAESGHAAVDFGTDSAAAVDYPDVIAPAARAVAAGDCHLGIVIGGSGTGEAITANKIHGIRCVEAADPVTARLGREHNDANILALGARIVGEAVARACVEAFLAGVFEGGRHARRVAKISELEVGWPPARS